MNEYSSVVIALLALFGTLIGALAQRRGKREDTHLDTSKWISDSIRQDNIEVRAEVRALREEVASLRVENLRLLTLASRFREIEEAESMGIFVDDWQALLNADVANRHGIHVAIYNDDIDEQVALGHRVVPIELVPSDVVVSAETIERHRRRLEYRAARIRQEHGLLPFDTSNLSNSPDHQQGETS